MSQHETFEQLKRQYLADAQAHQFMLFQLSFDELYTDKAGYLLTEARCNSVRSSVEFSSFITKMRLLHFNEIVAGKGLD